jgi:hypothetical protein
MSRWAGTGERRIVMIWPKACPHCHGDLARDFDLDGPFVGCIQCGRALSASQERALLGFSSARSNRKLTPSLATAGSRAA